MKPEILSKLEIILTRYKELETLLNSPNIFSNQKKYLEIFKEYKKLTILSRHIERWKIITKNILDTKKIMFEDPEIWNIAEDDLKQLNIDRILIEKKIHNLLTLKSFKKISSCFLEIRAGTGGHEAALFAGELFRMYSRYAEKYRWKIDVLNVSHGEHGGYKEIIFKVDHTDAYKKLRFESGGHRVQRIPYTETQGRVHTSSCTVAVIPEIPHVELSKITQNNLRIDTFRSSGAGGQHVNTTDSAIRITHIPTGIVVACQDERSQHKNKAKALEVLKARLSAIESKKRQEESSLTRKNLLGTGERSDRIRTYNFHQSRITDHRIGLTIYCLNEVMSGNLDFLIQSLTNQYESS